jgi:hypothetical protein
VARYVFLLYDAEDWYDTAGEQDIADEMRLHCEFMEAVRDAGASVLGGEALQRSSTATTVRTGDGDALVTDGPFADTKEVFGGWFMVEADDIDGALEVAGRIPAVRMGGCVEVRPIVEQPS